MLCEAFEPPTCRWSSYQFIFDKKLMKEGELTWLNKGCDDLQYQPFRLRRKAEKCQPSRKSITSFTYIVTVHNAKPPTNKQVAQSSLLFVLYSYFKQITLLWPQLVTTLNSTLTAPALASALQLTAKNKTMQSGIRGPQKFAKQLEAVNSCITLHKFLLFYDTSLRLHII